LITALVLAAGLTAVVWVRNGVRRIREAEQREKFNQELLCVALAYHQFAEERGSPPRGLVDIEAERYTFPQVYTMIRNGDFVIRWNARLTGNGVENDTCVLGYESKTPSQGGWVLMGGGGRGQVSASEFHALPLLPIEVAGELDAAPDGGRMQRPSDPSALAIGEETPRGSGPTRITIAC
jgi:hypothetical protein